MSWVSLTPRRLCRVSLRRNSLQIGSGLGDADLHAQHLAAAIRVDADGDRDDAAAATNLQIGGVDPKIRPVALDRSGEEGLHLSSISSHRRLTCALGDAAHAHRLDQIVDRAGRNTLDVGFLDDGRSRPFPPCGAVRESSGSSCRCAASGYAVPPCRPASPSLAHGSHCAGQAEGCPSRHRPRPSSPRPPTPSASRRQRRSSRAANPCPPSSQQASTGSSSRR